MFSGRRQSIRRQEDRKTHLCVDRYGHGLFTALLLIILLSVLDAYFTILQVESGAHEINPLMSFLIGQGYMYFFWVKYALTALAVLVLCIFKNHLIVRFSLPSILILYRVLHWWLHELVPPLMVDRAGGFLIREASICLEQSSIRAPPSPQCF